ncbi:PilT/PilU family type 4a pilus ATPase [Actimicrobium sp. CCI2.3]|uniref:PilT/PilU family type 4a pilus ATPase n=1 Tax=Actimicrobium sp. CCI2.3 TaxID=3048616 RepID=UPI002AB50C62|nr:PilT/PilU family type 4a pilus ATPase [Actimicrobium sp. CCI2.3]MDY7574557.1 PilT/PilU family type 4a pilus ATPase [Actimicrobium sp. CCI2.3]MEB0020933.1 PilT/PilU family type 4a pilus ATPase [Actimicrobium sp. CCI2.3]
MAMDRLFLLMKEKGASDMFLTVNSPIHLKINGNLVPINQQKMDLATIMTLIGEVVSAPRLQELERDNELNIGIPVSGVGSFRLSAFRQRSSISAVLRYIPHNIPDLATLSVPPLLSELIMAKRGLMLVVGSTGSGKSTTIASMLDYRNEHIAGHILTLEEPIEFLFRNKRSIVNQREIGVDAETLTVALKNALRQAPDCIMIGEIRDRETMEAAMAYAQSGHLVVSTLHANNSYRALNRIIGFFPLENRPALLQDLSSTITAIVSQRLVPAIDGGRVPAVEVLLNTRHIADLIEDGEIGQIRDAIEKSLSPGSQTFEQALLQLIRNGKITQEAAMANADSASNLFWMINNTASGNPASPDPVTVPDGPTFTEFTLNT